MPTPRHVYSWSLKQNGPTWSFSSISNRMILETDISIGPWYWVFYQNVYKWKLSGEGMCLQLFHSARRKQFANEMQTFRMNIIHPSDICFAEIQLQLRMWRRHLLFGIISMCPLPPFLLAGCCVCTAVSYGVCSASSGFPGACPHDFLLSLRSFLLVTGVWGLQHSVLVSSVLNANFGHGGRAFTCKMTLIQDHADGF